MPIGRPSSYTDEIAAEICERIADGESLRAICERDYMPDRMTVLRWMDKEEHKGFAARYARARVDQADAMDDKILKTADECTAENAAAARVKIDAYRWRASKLKPKVYGDKLAVTGGDPTTDAPIQHAVTVDPGEAYRRMVKGE